MRSILLAAALVLAGATAADAQTAAPASAAPAAGGYNTSDTDLGTLLDDPAAKAVLVKHIPDIVGNEQIEMARSMTLKSIQQYAGDSLTDAKLAAIDADLAKLKK